MRRLLSRFLDCAADLREGLARRARKRARKREVRRWFAADGDHTLRLDYELDGNSVVFDVGGYKGDWAEAIFQRYGSTIHVFEPVPCFARQIRERFDGNARILLHEITLADASGTVSMSVAGDETSLCQTGDASVRAAGMLRSGDRARGTSGPSPRGRASRA